MTIQCIITDLDNTIYPWVDFIVPALEAMVESLMQTTGMPKIKIVQALKKVYEEKGTNEYMFVLQESPIFEEFSYDFESFNALVIEPARIAFSLMKERYLALYPNVLETLIALKEMGVKVIALTDAPKNASAARIKYLGIEKYMTALYTQPSYSIPPRIAPEILKREQEGYSEMSIPIVELPLDFEKPDPRGILQIIADYHLDPRQVIYIGDNLKKDVVAAQQAHVIDIWAEYGTYIPQEYREKLHVMSARRVLEKNLSDRLEDQSIQPTYRISNFGILLTLIDSVQP